MEILQWLNTRFLASLLEAEEGKVDIFEYVIEPAVPDGYHWFNYLCRVIVKFRREANINEIKSASLIIKAASKNGLIKQYTNDLKFFQHEFYIYDEVLPEIHRRLGGNTVSPKKLFSLNDDVLVLEDLKPSGYELVDRRRQLDYNHTLSYVKQLAKLHAGTVALHERNPQQIENVGKELVFTEANKDCLHGKYYIDCFMLSVEALEGVGRYQRFCEKLRSVKDTLWDAVVTVMETEKHVRVLNHGDASMMNALYKHNVKSGTVADVKLIDYQLIRYASPAIDLHYLFMTSVRPEVVWIRFDELIDEYKETFNAVAEKMEAKTRLSTEQLEDELKFAGSYALLMACSLMPMIIVDAKKLFSHSSDGESTFSLDASVSPFVKIYENEQFKQVLVKLLAFLEHRGYF